MVKYFSKLPIGFSTLVELLRHRNREQPKKKGYTFLVDAEVEENNLTYGDFDCQARVIGGLLQSYITSGERVLLLYPPGLEYIVAFFGCLYAGVVAVPVYPPRSNQSIYRLQAIVVDAQAKVILTTTSLLAKIEDWFAQNSNLAEVLLLATDNIASSLAESWQEPTVNTDTLALLQYTSGSTGTPKGVMISHGNLLHNLALIHKRFQHTPSSQGVIWLPPYHDMGLIGGVLQPLYVGFKVTLMSPVTFLQKPFRWLEAISRYKATTSGGPNFAYNLCVNKITPEQLAALDLSTWDVAFNGAEPIHHKTLEQFAATFAQCGFRREAFYPCYGLAEGTLIVSGGNKADLPVVKTFHGSALEQNRVVETSSKNESTRSLVGCGQTMFDQNIVIIDPEFLTQCLPNRVGEIWVSGPSVTQGYWNRPEEMEHTFGACLLKTGEGPFLRTGDLGFWHDGELFITGRLKDMIIIRGRNHYPQDIELTVEQSHQALRPGCSAAFSVTVDDEERLVVVQELERHYRNPNIDEVVAAIRRAVTQEHELQVYAVVLVKMASIPKTSSGKIQRHASRTGFLAGSLNIVGSSILENSYVISSENSFNSEAIKVSTAKDRQSLLESYLQEQVALVLRIDPSRLNPQQPLNTIGIDSLMAVELQNRIATNLGVTLPMVCFLEGSSIAQLVTQVVELIEPIEAQPNRMVFPIQSVNREGKLPLSFAQEGLWFIDQLVGDIATYNMPAALHLIGRLNVAVFKMAVHEIVQRHEALRTIFSTVNGSPVQVIAPLLNLTLQRVDLQKLPEVEQLAQVQQLATEDTQRPFDLSNGPLLRVTLVQLANEEHVLLVTAHHIISDGWSIGIFIRELTTLYQAFSTEKPSPLPKLTIQYADFAYWQRQWLSKEVIETQLNYWKQQLAGASLLELPSDRPRPTVQTFQGSAEFFQINLDLTQKLVSLSQKSGTTLFMTLMAAFKTLLYRYTAQEDVVVGTDIANRNHPDIEGLIGFFVNQLVLRTDLSGNPTFQELLARLQKVTLEAYANQDLPFQKLVQELQPERSLNRTPLFQVKFILQNALQGILESPRLTLKPLKINSSIAQFDFLISMEQGAEGLTGTAIYSTDLFDAKTITQMLKQFQTLLQSIVTDPKQSLTSLSMLTNAETGNYTPADFANVELSQKDFENFIMELSKM